MIQEPTGDILFQIVPIFIGIIFVLVFGLILFSIVKGISQWNKNNQAPVLSVLAKVVTKRTSVNGGGETRAYNHYFVTFEMESGDRLEFKVKDEDFGMLVEGDEGKLDFQGTRFLSFTRKIGIQ